jgi:hypothetical protein
MDNLKKIEHIVVLMMENRSLTTSSVGFTTRRIPFPSTANLPPTDPYPDPGEPYEDGYEQRYNVPTVPLSQTPLPPSTPPTMQGFVNNYARCNSQNPEIIMNCRA